MIKKDFELIARIIRELPTCVRGMVARYFVTGLQAENPAFNPKKFLAACDG